MTYTVIIPTLFNSKVLHASLKSLDESDFEGKIIVVLDWASRGEDMPMMKFKNRLIVPRYSYRHSGPSGCVNIGLDATTADIIIYAHSDVLWPKRWFKDFKTAWAKDYGKIGMINLGFWEVFYKRHWLFHELFKAGRYNELLFLIKLAKLIGKCNVRDVTIKDKSNIFGYPQDPWSRLPMNGRTSCAVSFRREDVGQFSDSMPAALSEELHIITIQNRKWSAWLNNNPLIHLISYDTDKIPTEILKQQADESERKFSYYYGFSVSDVHSFYRKETIEYYFRIIDAFNNNNFGKIDFLFDEFLMRASKVNGK